MTHSKRSDLKLTYGARNEQQDIFAGAHFFVVDLDAVDLFEEARHLLALEFVLPTIPLKINTDNSINLCLELDQA